MFYISAVYILEGYWKETIIPQWHACFCVFFKVFNNLRNDQHFEGKGKNNCLSLLLAIPFGWVMLMLWVPHSCWVKLPHHTWCDGRYQVMYLIKKQSGEHPSPSSLRYNYLTSKIVRYLMRYTCTGKLWLAYIF